MKTTKGSPSSKTAVSRHFNISYMIFCFCMGTTVALWMLARKSVEREALLRFETQTNQIAAFIELRLHTYIQTLYQTRGFFITKGIPSRNEFATYIKNVNVADNYPGIQGIGFTQRIPEGELNSHIARIRAQGSPNYTIYPAGDRSEYHSIIMLEPFDWRNQRAFGYDMHTNAVRREAMDRARDTGLPQITALVTLVQETETNRQPGFLVYLPLYENGASLHTVEDRRQALLGFVYSPFRSHDFFTGIFGQPDPKMGLAFEVYYGSERKRETLIYDRDAVFQEESGNGSTYSRTIKLNVPGHNWTLYSHSLPAFGQEIANTIPYYVLGSGVILSFLIFGLLQGHAIKVRNEYILFTEAQRELAERRRTEAELRNSEERYRVLTETTAHGVWTANRDGVITYSNRWWQDYTGLATGESRHEDWESVVHPLHQKRMEDWLHRSDPKSVEEIEIPIRRAADGSYRWHLARRSAVRDHDERILQWVTVAIDIHRLKELEEARRAREEELRIITDALPALISYTDKRQKLRFINAEYERWFNRPLQEIMGLDSDELWASFLTNIDQEQQFRQAALEGQRVSFETVLRHSDGSLRPANIIYVPRTNPDGGGTEGFFALITDLSRIKQMEEELKDNQERFELVTRSVNLGLWYSNPPFDKLICNPWLKKHFWLPDEAEVTFELFYERLHPDDREKTRDSIQRSLYEQLPLDIEHRTVDPLTGATKWIRAIGKGFYDELGKPIRFAGVSLDITEKKRRENLLHEQMRTTETLYKVGKTLAAELDVSRLLQIITDSAKESTGAEFGAFFHSISTDHHDSYQLVTLSGAQADEFARFPKPKITGILAETFAGGQIVRLADVTQDARFGRSGPHYGLPLGHLNVCSYLAVPVKSRDGTVIGGLLFGHNKPGMFSESSETLVAGIALQAAIALDNAALFKKAEDEIAKRREAEDNLRALNEELEARVQDRTAQLLAANRELEAFAYSVSHDLRAPLRGIDGFSTVLEKRYSGALDDQGRHYLKRVKDAAGRMSHLIDDMLNLTRLTRQEMQRQPLDLSAMAHSIARFLLDSETHRQVEFRIQDNMQTRADPILMRAVLENLMGNAWKFTSQRESGALIEVACERVDGEPVYHVRDNGAGFDMEYAEKLFRPFQRLHSTQEFPGSGIGLASVQRVIHRHGGKVWAEGQVNGGATFYFTLTYREGVTV